MNRIKEEMQKSIKYVIPIVLIFVGIGIIQNYSQIVSFFRSNIEVIGGILTPFLIGFVIAYVLNHPMKYIENKFNIKRGICVALIYGVLLALVVFVWLYIVPVVKSNVVEIYNYIPHGINQIENMITSISNEFNININNANAREQINEFITTTIIPLSTSVANALSQTIINLMGTVVSYTFNIFLGIVISIYLLLSKEKSVDISANLCKILFGKYYCRVREFIKILDKNIGTYIVAKAIDSAIYGLSCTVLLYILNSKYALFLGLVVGVTNMIPFFGPIIGTVIVTIINLLFSFDKAVVILIAMIIAQQIESAVLEPYFVGKQVGVPPIITILSVTLAGQYTGFIGMMMSVPIAGVIIIYVNRFIEKYKRSEDDSSGNN